MRSRPSTARSTRRIKSSFARATAARTGNGSRRILTRPNPAVPAALDAATAADSPISGPRRGVVYAVAPSPLRAATLWAGTDDGFVWLTRDGGKSWRNVTPPQLSAWSKVGVVEASHFAEGTAYVAVDRHRLDDDRPSIYATRDFGRTWRAIVAGIPEGSFVNAVREDPVQRGLLYAATETAVYVSFDGGGGWESLRANMPVVSVRDLVVHGDDLAIATHGRAFWILDDVEPLRELAANAVTGPHLFAPATAIRTRPGNDEAEASPPEEPVGENAPSGAAIDYVVPDGVRGPLALAIVDPRGDVLRAWSSDDKPTVPSPNDVPFPAYWIEKPAVPSAAPGMHRFRWDYHVAGSASRRRRRGGGGPFAPPGSYVVRMTLGGRTYSQPLVLRRDPRVHATDAGLRAQYALASAVDELLARVQLALTQAADARKKPGANAARIDAIAGAPPLEDPRNSVGMPATSFTTLRWYAGALGALEGSVESADEAPTPDERAAWARLLPGATSALHAWSALAPR